MEQVAQTLRTADVLAPPFYVGTETAAVLETCLLFRIFETPDDEKKPEK